jgi:hypothetical protein
MSWLAIIDMITGLVHLSKNPMKSKVRGLVCNFILLMIVVIVWHEAVSGQGFHLSSLQRIAGWLCGGAVIVQYTFPWKLKQQGKGLPPGHPWLGIILLLMSLCLLILGYK